MSDTTTECIDFMLAKLNVMMDATEAALSGLIARYEHLRVENEAYLSELADYARTTKRLRRVVEEAMKFKPTDCEGWDDTWCPTSCSWWRVCGLDHRWEPLVEELGR